MADLNRRKFIAAAAAGAAWLTLGGCQNRGDAGGAPGDAAMAQKSDTPPQPLQHPFLFFTAADVPKMRAAAKTTHRKYFDDLSAWCKEFDGLEPLTADKLPTDRDVAQVYFENAAACAINTALLWHLTGDDHRLAVALKWLNAFSTYPVDIDGGYFVGSYALGLAASYDMLYPALDDAARARARDHLAAVLDRGVKGTSIDWWAGLLVHHDHYLPAAGLCVGAAAIAHETPGGADRLAFLSQHFDKTLNACGDDGAWTEGVGLWVYAVAMGYIWFDVCKRVTGRDLFQTPVARGNIAYRLFNWLPGDKYVFHHDSGPSGRYNIMGAASCHVMRKLAAELKNPQAQWLADQDEPTDLRFLSQKLTAKPDWMTNRFATVPATHVVAWNFLWYDPAVPSHGPEDLPRQHYFPNQGLVIARSGWGPRDVLLTFTCAPYGGHQARALVLAGDQKLASNMGHIHTDSGSFNLFSGSNGLVIGPGYGGNASSYENTLTIEGANQQLNPRYDANILRTELADDHVYIAADATDTYPPATGLARWIRHLAWLSPDILIIADDLTAKTPSARGLKTVWRMDFDFDADAAVLAQPNQEFRIASRTGESHAALTGRLLEPQGMQLAVQELRQPRANWSMCGQVQASMTDIFKQNARARIVAVLQVLEDPAARAARTTIAVTGPSIIGAAIIVPTEHYSTNGYAAVFVTSDGIAGLWPINFTLPNQNFDCWVFGLPADTACAVQFHRETIPGACNVTLSKGGPMKTSAAGTLLIKSTGQRG